MYLVKLDETNTVDQRWTLADVADLPLLTRLTDCMIVALPVAVGAVYDPETNTFSTPARRRWVTTLAFRQRMTDTERLALKQAQLLPARGAEETDPDYAARCAMPLRLQDMSDLLAAANYIDLTRADTRAMVQSLEAMQLLAAGRAVQILDGVIAAHEYHPDA